MIVYSVTIACINYQAGTEAGTEAGRQAGGQAGRQAGRGCNLVFRSRSVTSLFICNDRGFFGKVVGLVAPARILPPKL